MSFLSEKYPQISAKLTSEEIAIIDQIWKDAVNVTRETRETIKQMRQSFQEMKTQRENESIDLRRYKGENLELTLRCKALENKLKSVNTNTSTTCEHESIIEQLGSEIETLNTQMAAERQKYASMFSKLHEHQLHSKRNLTDYVAELEEQNAELRGEVSFADEDIKELHLEKSKILSDAKKLYLSLGGKIKAVGG